MTKTAEHAKSARSFRKLTKNVLIEVPIISVIIYGLTFILGRPHHIALLPTGPPEIVIVTAFVVTVNEIWYFLRRTQS